jgi:hypothetical protein
MNRIFLLNYKNGPAMTNIIGATSPATLFFSSANDLSYVAKSIQFGSDKPFDAVYMPLYQRDLEYQKYWYLLQRTIPNFAGLFREVDAYLNESFKSLPANEQQIIRNLVATDLQNFSDIPVGGAGNPVEVLGNNLKKKKQNPMAIQNTSGFVIASPYQINGHSPLVLPVDTYALPTTYTQAPWDSNTKVPFSDAKPLTHRTLPADGSPYPYLTIGDFLEDTIIRMPYDLNVNSFFDGNINNARGKSYLLPLTDLFFDFFTADQLRGSLPDGKKMFELKTNAGGVTATLRIPIQNNKYIEYSRIYFENNVPDIEKNKGGLIEKGFGLGIFPLVRFNDNVKKHYRIALFDKGERDITLTCFEEGNLVPTSKVVVRREKDIDNDICSVESYVINNNFDRIVIRAGQSKCVLIPKYRANKGNAKYTFSIDFGTTNTHIEYLCSAGGPSEATAFDIAANEKQIQRLHLDYKQDKDISGAFEDNFVPDTIADNNDLYSFPMRTVFAEHNGIDYSKNLHTLADGNIPFRYEKALIPIYNDTKTNLKWSTEVHGQIKLYLENIFLLLRNKVILKGGKLEDTKIIWFYPASMTEGRYNKFKSLWNTLYKEYFGDNEANVISMSESVAPYYYYSEKQGAQSNVVTIDIGGGTTDVYIVENKSPKMLVSFRFASNAIFGDGYNWDADNNGFVNLFKDEFSRILSTNKLDELKNALDSIAAKKISSDIVAFLFALSSNRQVNNNENLNFLKQLSDNEKLKYVFVLFYSAILYFIAKAMKIKGLSKPRTLAFSGNGSKTLRILSDDNNTLAKFVKLIFDGVFDGQNDGNMDIRFEEYPKKATCKGGILHPDSQDFDRIDQIKCTMVGHDLEAFITDKACYSVTTPDTQKKIVQAVIEFINFIFELDVNNDNFFNKKFDVDAGIGAFVREICLNKQDLEEYLSLGLDRKYEELAGKPKERITSEELRRLKESNKIEETLFFYPLIGMLNKLAREISQL